MPRTVLSTPVILTRTSPTAGQVLAYQAADNTNHNFVSMSGSDLLLVRNATGGAVSITIQTLADPYGRVGNITESVAANTVRVYGPFGHAGFQQSDGSLWIDGATGLDLAVIRLP